MTRSGCCRRATGPLPATGATRRPTRWFYDCSYEIHRGLAELYVADQRFTENIDRHAPGLARYMRDAILANADHGQS